MGKFRDKSTVDSYLKNSFQPHRVDYELNKGEAMKINAVFLFC